MYFFFKAFCKFLHGKKNELGLWCRHGDNGGGVWRLQEDFWTLEEAIMFDKLPFWNLFLASCRNPVISTGTSCRTRSFEERSTMRWKKWWRRVRDGNMDACRPHGHIPSLLVLFGDQFWLVCRLPIEDTELPVEDTELPIEGTKLPLSLFWAILLTCNVLLATCNYSMGISFIFLFFFSFFFLKNN